MLAQLRSRYPTASLISELLTIYLGKYVVRAVVEIDGAILTTGLAAADTVELAEDQAKKRAIQSLDIDTTRPQPSTPREPLKPTPMELKPEVATPVSVPAASPNLESPPPLAPSSIPDQDSEGIPSASLTSDDWLSATYIQPKTDKTPDKDTESKSSSAKGSKGRSASLPPVPASPEVIPTYPDEPEFSKASAGSGRSFETTDFSSDIAKTDIELKRLQWTQEQGRAHLLKTYGKRSRQHLTDNELLDFLHYLESISIPTESP